MISVAAAKKIIGDHTSPLPVKEMALQESAGLVLAADIYAAVTIPGFPQSSMDGYAFAFDDLQPGRPLPLSGIVAAGNSSAALLKPGTAVRIFTGAAVPPGADTIVMQEKTRVENNQLLVLDLAVERGMNLRPEGAEIQKGALALLKNSMLTPAAIGFLTSIGIATVSVYPKPVVGIIITGDELQVPGQALAYGQVYECNSFVLKAVLQQLHITNITSYAVKDNLELVTETLGKAIAENDLVFVTGGISVGDFDFVLQASINNGVEQLFHKIKQRPAKPLFFGKKGSTCIFGLPGNPASGLVSFYEYALPVIGTMCNRNYAMPKLMVPIASAYKKAAGLTHFLKGFYSGRDVVVLEGQESFRMSSFAKANCLVQVDEAVTACATGEMVEVHLLPA